MSQEQLGARLGLTFQQIQKYERGINRISASRLWEISQVLEVPVSWFFDDGNHEGGDELRMFSGRDTLQLVRHYTGCSPAVKKRTLALLKAAARANA